MSRKACEKCHDAGLTDEQVEEIREDEAVIDPMDEGEYSYKHVFGDDDWKK